MVLTLWGWISSALACNTALTQTTLRHYNDRAAEYTARHSRTTETIQRLYGTFVSLLPTNKEPGEVVVVDLGAGHGRETLQFRRDEIEVIPVEPAQELAKITEERSGVPVFRQLAQNLDLRHQVDGVWAMASLIHIPVEELPRALERIKRHLKVGGVMFISICFNVGTPNVGEIDAKGRYFNRVTPERWRELIAQAGGFEVIEQHTGVQRDDFHGAAKPSVDFSFFNLFVRRVAEPGKVHVVTTKDGLEGKLGNNHLWVARNVTWGQTFMTHTFDDGRQTQSKKATWEYRLNRVDPDGDLGGKTFEFVVSEVRSFEDSLGTSADLKHRKVVLYVQRADDGTIQSREVSAKPITPLKPDAWMDPSGQLEALRERVIQAVMESDGRSAIP